MKITDRRISKQIKGIASIFIMLGHFLPIGCSAWIASLFYGPVWVGVFFFLSGYGLKVKTMQDPNYLSGFVFGKLRKVWIPFAIAELVFFFSRLILLRETLNVRLILGSLIGAPLSNDILWYVVELLILEGVFWLLEKTQITKKSIPYFTSWTVSYFLFVLVSVLFDVGNWWYVSTSAFLMGLFFARYEKQCTVVLKKKWCKVFCMVATVILYCMTMALFKWQLEIPRIPTNMMITGLTMCLVPLFVICVAYLAELSKGKCRALLFLGDISYEIYLYHIWVQFCFSRLLTEKLGNVISLGITIVGSLIVAAVVNRVSGRLKKAQ